MAITVILNEWTFTEWLDSDDEQWFPYSLLLLYPLKTFIAADEPYHFTAKDQTYYFVAENQKYYFIAENE